MQTARTLRDLRGVVFDMDGTLTVSTLDFHAIRAECGAPAGEPLLEYIENAPEEARRRAQRILEAHERRAATRSPLRDGAREVLAQLRRRGLKLGLVTRNSADSVRTFLARFGLEFDCWISREDARPKPAPDAMHRIAQELRLDPQRLLVVGDYMYDVQAGNAAGAVTAFIRTEKNHVPPAECDFVLDSLRELLALVPEPT